MPELRPVPQGDEKFLVAFSFAGEQRDLVRSIAEATEQLLGWGTVFYDEWYTAELAGGDADLDLQDIYGKRSEFTVPCLSGAYDDRYWTGVEWREIRSNFDRLIPVRVGEGEVRGLPEKTTIWLDAIKKPATQIAKEILARVRSRIPDAGKLPVFLAQTFDLEDEEDEDNPRLISRPKLRTYLADLCGCSVFPKTDLVVEHTDDYGPALRRSLKKTLAFVQLHSSKPWRGGRVPFDETQFEVAHELEIPKFCFQTKESKDANHKAFIERTHPIAGSFDDFKQHLKRELAELAEKEREAIRQRQMAQRPVDPDRPDNSEESPLVRVAFRAGDALPIWKKVYNFLYKQQDVVLEELPADATFKGKQAANPCHGFLILCDQKTTVSKKLSPLQALSECLEIQIGLGRKVTPPVAVVFRTPPEAEEADIVRATPKCLSFVLDHQLEVGLAKFLQQVREARRTMS